MARRILSLLIAVVAVAGLAIAASGSPARAGGGCHGADAARLTDEVTNTVLASDCAFMPTVVRVDVGAPVTWTNNDKVPHTFTGVSGSFGDYKEHVAGQSVSYSFEKSGVYPYFCALHPGMVGAVIVGDVSTSAAGALDAARLVSVQVPGEEAGGTQPSASESSDGGVSTTALALVVGAVVLVVAAGAGVAVMRRRGVPG
ncbi:MAG TPA: plastocyanin/azurin family copper-binding protein [Dehalococcoidia bacterium]|nr:plastocyanin/azurin family copper-binding protein [Dehalococcoidia bacterium]